MVSKPRQCVLPLRLGSKTACVFFKEIVNSNMQQNMLITNCQGRAIQLLCKRNVSYPSSSQQVKKSRGMKITLLHVSVYSL